jgi:coiled-coil and C2 domain-containing protein 2A
MDVIGTAKISEDEHFRDLAKIVVSYYVNGFPLNLPYTDVQDVVKAVFNTNIQHNENGKAEFAIAVEVVPYPCKICSVWVYVLAVTPKDT